MKIVSSGVFFVMILLLVSSCGSLATIVPERIENNILGIEISESTTTGRDGFRKLTVSIKNNSDKELEFSDQSFFEDSRGRYYIINLPSRMFPNSTRPVLIRRTSNTGQLEDSDLNVHDIFITLLFKVDDVLYSNTYHLYS